MGTFDTSAPIGSDERAAQEDRVSDTLVNVYGLKLPNEMFSQAARSNQELARILKEYANAVDKSQRA